jgi:2OG-Fe(II) oxygenase superfamily
VPDMDLVNTSSTHRSHQQSIVLGSFTETLDRLRIQSETFRNTYALGKPYPHLAIEGLFNPEVLDRLVAEFPEPSERDWLTWDTVHESKATSRGISGLSTFTQLFCLWLNSAEFITEIERITGIDNLVGDPTFFGAGLHEMYKGGWLGMHTDWTGHPSLSLTRRLNLLIYLNRDWDAAWGGDIELWDKNGSGDRVAYPPFFNQTVLFPTTSETFHGAPRQLSCPEGCSRKLLSIYYWTPVPLSKTLKRSNAIVWADGKINLDYESLRSKLKIKVKSLFNRATGMH